MNTTIRPMEPYGAVRYRCGACNMPIPNFGRRKQAVRGALVWVGKCCQRKPAQ